MARKEADKFLADRGIAEDFREEFFRHLDAGDDGAALSLFLDKGLDIDLYIRTMNEWDAHWAEKRPVRHLFRARIRSTFDEELGERLKYPEFRKLFMEEMEKLRQGRK